MAAPLRLDDLRRAWDSRDPRFVDLVVRLAEQPDEEPEQPIREGALTFDRFLSEMRSYAVRRKSDEEQAHWRQETVKALEAPTAEVPLPARLRVHELIYALWTTDEAFARRCLFDVIARVPLVYGPWRALKRIFKEAEAKPDTEVYGALAARFDMAFARGYGVTVSSRTLGYLVRRAWRFLRLTGVRLPATYADVATDFLTRYTDDTNWRGTWIANHIFYHESRQYGRHRWHGTPGGMLKHRAFADLWQRSPRPLFALLERAQADQVFQFATDALKTDFRALLREVEPDWVARLVNVNSRAVHAFVVWILTNVPRFEQGKFRDLGLHGPVLRLFDSPSDEARVYAASYARTHARDLPVDELVRLANNSNDAVRKLAADLLLSRDPRKDVGLDAWGRLLETDHGHALAADVLKKHFGPKELTPAWFADRLYSPSRKAFQFAKGHLPQVHPTQKLGAEYFMALIDRANDPEDEAAANVVPFALSELGRFDLNALDPDFLKRLLLHPLTQRQAVLWVEEGRLKPQALGVDFLKTAAFHPAWDTDPWLTSLRTGPRKWGRELHYSEPLGDTLLGWLADVRRFTPAEVGMDWLLTLVQRGEGRYHDFAVERLIKSFAPSDFAPQAASPSATPQATESVDLQKATFVFTGKLATMVRKEAEEKVKAANGTVAGSVTKNLHYLVIGDEGSPLYGAGKKGDKQLKAEDLNAKGANIRIISETAFLQMLARGAPSAAASTDATLAGCERLWAMVAAPGPADAPLGSFARKYIRRHHPDIAPAETDRPVDPGYEVPPSFLSFDRVRPLFAETRKPLRDFALDLAKWEFARWNPPAIDLVHLCELPFPEVRQFVGEALLADDHPKHARYRLNPDTLSPAGVYAFCESTHPATRALGVQLIDRSPRLKVPEELFRLTESPDRKVRAFVIRTLWALYRDRGVTPDWQPTIPPQTTVSEAARKAAAETERRGPGVPHRPERRPADDPALAMFLRRILFEIPPGRMEPPSEEDRAIFEKLKPLPARKAKLSLVEVMRDLALEDEAFARGVLPVLREFLGSHGPSERDACLVAVTRIRAKHPAVREVVTR